jgi:hypothetical protein
MSITKFSLPCSSSYPTPFLFFIFVSFCPRATPIRINPHASFVQSSPAGRILSIFAFVRNIEASIGFPIADDLSQFSRRALSSTKIVEGTTIYNFWYRFLTIQKLNVRKFTYRNNCESSLSVLMYRSISQRLFQTPCFSPFKLVMPLRLFPPL